MADKAFRLLRILELVPRDPGRITAAELAEQVSRPWRGMEFGRQTRRTLERDLNALYALCPGLEREERGNAYAWYWRKGSAMFSVPRMDASEAVALDTARRFLVPILPASVSGQLEPYFAIADEVLKETERGRRGPRWRDKVRVVAPSQPISAPRADANVVRTVLEALFDNRQIEFKYRNAQGNTKTHANANPLAIIYWGEIAYLLASGLDEKVIQYALHRIVSARKLDSQPVRRPAGFEVDQWIEEGHLGIRRGGTIPLEALFRGPRSRRFHEASLSPDQTVEQEGDWLRVRATVNDTEELRWWLLGFGADAEVLAPASLRQDIRPRPRRWHSFTARPAAAPGVPEPAGGAQGARGTARAPCAPSPEARRSPPQDMR